MEWGNGKVGKRNGIISVPSEDIQQHSLIATNIQWGLSQATVMHAVPGEPRRTCTVQVEIPTGGNLAVCLGFRP